MLVAGDDDEVVAAGVADKVVCAAVFVYDVSTDAATLEATGMDVSIYDDLQTGRVYANFDVTAADVGSVLDIPLNALAISDIIAASESVSVGIHVATAPIGGPAQWMRFSAGSEARTHQLVVSGDCNMNSVPDDCDVSSGTSDDCHNCCETGHGAGCTDVSIEACVCAFDPYCCNTNWDSLCVSEVTSLGCGICGELANGIPDECEPDCDLNGVADSCDIAAGTHEDCNQNGVPDSCDIANGTSADTNGDGVPDECGS